MEYIIITGIAIAVFIFLYLIIKVEKFRNRANALFLEAEKYLGDFKMHQVCCTLYNRYVPNVVKWFIDEQTFANIVQMIYNNSRKVAKDLLDDR